MRAQTTLAVLAVTAFASVSPVLAADRARVATLAGTVALVRPASARALADMSFGQRFLDALGHPEQALELDSALEDGDGLRTEDAEAAVMLECASGATQTLKGPFDVILRLRADRKGCKIEVREGQVTATTASDPDAMPEGRPEQQYGDVTLGASSTLFGLAVSGGEVECFVIDGAIVATRDHAPVWSLNAGQQLSVNARAVSAISETRLEYVANTYARLDVTALPAAERAAKQIQLRNDYVAAFRNPEDTEVRARLVRNYSATGTTPAGAYQVRKEAVLRQRAVNHAADPVVRPADRVVAPPQNFNDTMIVAPH